MSRYSRVLILSGVTTKVAEGLKKHLSAQQISSVFCELTEDKHYFVRLIERTLEVLSSYSDDDKLHCLLASFTMSQNEEVEQQAFFPAVRRVHVKFGSPRPTDSEFAKKAELFAQQFKKLELRTADIRNFHRGCLFLPIVNTKSDKFRADLLRLFMDIDAAPNEKLVREFIIDNTPGRPGLRSQRNNLIFARANNNPRHPVRRVSDTPRAFSYRDESRGIPKSVLT